MFKLPQVLLSCACVVTCVSSVSSTAYAVCRENPFELFWTSVDAQARVSQDSQILLSFLLPEETTLTVTLDEVELVPEEITRSYARYAHPSTMEPGDKTLTITVMRDYGEQPDDVELPEPVVLTRQYTLVESTIGASSYDVSIIDAQSVELSQPPATQCENIFSKSNCFDLNVPTFQRLTLSSTEHPYFVEEYVTKYSDDGEKQVWQSSGFYPAGCTPLVETTHRASSVCFRAVTVDEQGQRHEGEMWCQSGDTESQQQDASCSITAVSQSQSKKSMLLLSWLTLLGLFIRVRKWRA